MLAESIEGGYRGRCRGDTGEMQWRCSRDATVYVYSGDDAKRNIKRRCRVDVELMHGEARREARERHGRGMGDAGEMQGRCKRD